MFCFFLQKKNDFGYYLLERIFIFKELNRTRNFAISDFAISDKESDHHHQNLQTQEELLFTEQLKV